MKLREKCIRCAFCAIASLAITICPPAAADYFDGLFAFEQGDYAAALDEWSAGARLRDPESLFGLGQLYEGGYGVQADPVRAYALFDIAAESGFAPARDARQKLSTDLSFQDLAKGRSLAKELRRSGEFVARGSTAAVVEPEPLPEPEIQVIEPQPEPSVPTESTQVAVPEPEPEPIVVQPIAPTDEPRLTLGFTCRLEASWRDRGSGGIRDVATYRPVPPAGHRTIGSYVQGNYGGPTGCVTVIGPGATNSGAGTPLLVAPVDWQRVWADKGSGARLDGAVWNGVAPGSDYVCLGSVARVGYGKPNPGNYTCIHRCLTRSIATPAPVWTDEGTGARAQVAFYQLPTTNALYAVSSRKRPRALIDLDPNAACLYQ